MAKPARVKVREAPAVDGRPSAAMGPPAPRTTNAGVVVSSFAWVAIVLGLIGIAIGVYVFNNLNGAGEASVSDQVEIGKTVMLSGSLLLGSGVGTLGLDRAARRGP